MVKRLILHDYAEYCVNSGDLATEDESIYRWIGTHWAPQTRIALRKAAYAWLVKEGIEYATANNADKCIDGAGIHLGDLPERTTDIVIPCANGYVLVKDDNQLTFIAPSKEYGLRYCLHCAYLPDFGPAPLFEKFLETVLPVREVRDRVQEYIGYSLIPDTRFQRAQFWMGSGANGKGVLANIVQKLHAKVATVHLDALGGFKLTEVIGASLIYVDETPQSRIDEVAFKSLVAGEMTQIDRKYVDPVSVRCLGKWIILGNSFPRISDHSHGFFRRLDIVPFDITVPEEERDALLAEKIIQSELSGVLNWALEGLLRLLSRGKFDPQLPEAMSSLLLKSKREGNSVHSWHDDSEVTLSSTQQSLKEDIYRHFQEWCITNGTASVDSAQFWKRLKGIVDFAESRHRQGTIQKTWCNLVIPGVNSRDF